MTTSRGTTGDFKLEYVIESQGLIKNYGDTRALNAVDIQVRPGEIFGFLGPNGAGKTTFVKILLNFVHFNEGSIQILDSSPRELDRERIGYLPERISIHPFLTAYEFLVSQCRLICLPENEIDQEVNEVLEKVHMTDAAHRRISGYSKGMMQRVGLAQAILGKPELLILDEPNSGLDPLGVMQIREAILAEKERGATVFLNSHQLLEVEKTCDRVAILNHGEVVAQGSANELTGGEQGVVLELEEVTEELMSYLKSLDKGLRSNGETMELSITDSEVERTLPARIIEKGARILHYSKKRESLEEVFKRLVQKSDAK